MRDLDFLAGRFFDFEVPKQKRYLLKYFVTDLQQAFLRYYLLFGEIGNFVDHTGHYCSKRLLFKLQARYRQIELAYEKAKLELTEESMAIINQIESGQFP